VTVTDSFGVDDLNFALLIVESSIILSDIKISASEFAAY